MLSSAPTSTLVPIIGLRQAEEDLLRRAERASWGRFGAVLELPQARRAERASWGRLGLVPNTCVDLDCVPNDGVDIGDNLAFARDRLRDVEVVEGIRFNVAAAHYGHHILPNRQDAWTRSLRQSKPRHA